MSSARRAKRKKARDTGIEAHKQNKGGFYKGMPGVFLDKHGNRRIYEVRLTPEGEVEGLIGAHPKQVMACLEVLMDTSPQIRNIVILTSRKYRIRRRRKRLKAIFVNWWANLFKKKKEAPERTRSEKVTPELQAKIDKEKELLADKVSKVNTAEQAKINTGLKDLTNKNTEA